MSVFKKQTSRKGSVVYEEVLQKNFQIIQTFLKKFHQIFTKQDQFEEHLNKFASKFAEYDEFLDEFKQEQRLSIVMLQKKVNNMKSSVRQSHRTSHRFSKINIPIFEATETLEGTKSNYQPYEDFTLLKFNSIDTTVPNNEQPKSETKQSEQSAFSSKQYDQMQQSIASVKEQILQMKDKISFLSAYTSSMSNNDINKSKVESIKKQILDCVQSDVQSKVGKQIRQQMVETQKVFLQQINNLAVKFSDQLKAMIQKKFWIVDNQLKQFENSFFTKDQAKGLEKNLKSDLNILAKQCSNMFSNKQQTRRSLTLLQKKLKNINFNTRQQLNKKAQLQKQPIKYFTSIMKVNQNKKQPRPSTSLHNNHKSQSQLIKLKESRLNLSVHEQSKQNIVQKSQRSQHDFVKGALFTSQVSKQFMKNFGIKQRKLVKGNYQNIKRNSCKDHQNQRKLQNMHQESGIESNEI